MNKLLLILFLFIISCSSNNNKEYREVISTNLYKTNKIQIVRVNFDFNKFNLGREFIEYSIIPSLETNKNIVTIEDLIEEVFGDIEDEYDDENKEIEVIKEDEYIVDGSAKLDVISELIGVNMESEEFDSVGGLLIGELGRFPEQNEEITLNNIKFTVEEIDKNRVKKVRIFT